MISLLDTISQSAQVLENCVQAASAFNRAGTETINVGIGVYGSYGRLEAREVSDLELCVFYENAEVEESDDTAKADALDLSEFIISRFRPADIAANFWNRMAKSVEGTHLHLEDASAFFNPKTGLYSFETLPDDLCQMNTFR